MVRTALSGLGFWAGVVAAGLAIAVLLGARSVLGILTPTDLMADRFTAILPLAVFSALLGALETAAKPVLNVSLMLAQILVGGLGGMLFFRTLKPGAGIWRAGAGLAIGVWLLFGLLVLPLVGGGLFGSGTPAGVVPTMVMMLAGSLAYGVGLAAFGAWVTGTADDGGEEPAAPDIRGRRQVITGLGAAIVLVGLGTIAWRFAGRVSARAIGAVRGMPSEITSNEDFYTISKNFFDPVVDGPTWRLNVVGEVSKPYQLTYEELLQLESVEQVNTLECISNEVGGELIGNAVWRGVRLRDLIARAEPKQGIRKVVFKCADDYEDSIHFAKAMEPTTLLVYEMNGERLPPAHGFPARMIIPDIYGMKNAKWVTEIRLLDTDFKGFWQERDWSDEAVIKVMSRIDAPAIKRVEQAPTMIGGVAFAGARGVEKVEVSVDGGKTWQEATVKPPLSKMAWALWTFEWQPPSVDSYRVFVRATDGTGHLQEHKPADPLPDGKQGYHDVLLTVGKAEGQPPSS